MNIIQQLEKEQADKLAAIRPIPDFEAGDTIQVNVKVVEGHDIDPIRGIKSSTQFSLQCHS